MELAAGKPDTNREMVKQWVEQVMKDEAPDLIVLPEMWTTSYLLDEIDELAEADGEATKAFLSGLSKEHNINIIGGSVAVKRGKDIYNTSYIYNRAGELVYEYSKIHLVPMLHEPAYLTGGKERAEVFELDGVKMGVIICYDLRFPELARKLALEGAQVLFVPAEWPKARTEHWVNLQLARAIENQMYVISANNIGTVGDVEYAGNSLIIDPWGDVLARGSADKPETLAKELNFERVKQVREDVPIFKSRVEHLY